MEFGPPSTTWTGRDEGGLEPAPETPSPTLLTPFGVLSAWASNMPIRRSTARISQRTPMSEGPGPPLGPLTVPCHTSYIRLKISVKLMVCWAIQEGAACMAAADC